MSTRTRGATRSAAAAVAAALVIVPNAAMASDFPLEPRPSENSVAQSVQIRANADGTPNGSAVDFRWSVTQITASGDPNTQITVKVPEEGALLHNLQKFGTIPQEDGQGVYDISLNDQGFGTARSVSLFPQDMDLPVEITAEFTLDGEPITSTDLVGRSGLVTATYTVTNTTGQEVTVPITSVTGDEVEKTVTSTVPMVVEAGTFLPQAWAGLNTGTGLGGADGRGNWQIKWIALPFAPLSADGTAQFGWAANVTDAVIPAMVVQVLPIYIPEGAGEEEAPTGEDVVNAGQKLGVPPPDVSGDVADIQAGVTDIISGLETLTADDGGADPLTTVEEGLNNFFTEFGTNIETIATLVDPNNPDGATALVKELQGIVDEASATVNAIDESGVVDQIEAAAEVLTPATAQRLVELNEPLNLLAENAETISRLAEIAPAIGLLADNAETIAGYIRLAGVTPKPVLVRAIEAACADSGGSPASVCDDPAAFADLLKSDEVQRAADILESPEFQQAADLLNSDQFQQAAELISSEEFARAAAALDRAAPVLVPVAESLQVMAQQLPGIITTLQPVLNALDGVLATLEGALVQLSAQMQIIGQGIADTSVDLPTVDALLAQITATILESEGGQQVTEGISQLGSGISGVKSELSAWVAELVVALQAAKAEVAGAVESGKEAAGAVIDKADTLKAEVAGLVMAAHQSPLPYGGDPAEAPEGTKLAGAYEFRLDPADTEAPATMPRVLIAVILLLVAGFVGNRVVATRRAAAAGGPDVGPDGSSGPGSDGPGVASPVAASAAGVPAGAGAATAAGAAAGAVAESESADAHDTSVLDESGAAADLADDADDEPAETADGADEPAEPMAGDSEEPPRE